MLRHGLQDQEEIGLPSASTAIIILTTAARRDTRGIKVGRIFEKVSREKTFL